MLRASISQITSVYLYTVLTFLPSLAQLSADILHLYFTFLLSVLQNKMPSIYTKHMEVCVYVYVYNETLWQPVQE